MSWIFGNKSSEVLCQLHSDLQMILVWGLKYSPVDFGLNDGYRSPEKQFEYFKVGRKKHDSERWIPTHPDKKGVITNCDGYQIKSKHNYNPSLAVDLKIYVLGKPSLTYDVAHLSLVAGVLIASATFLYEQGKIQHKLRWGGNWDKDGEILFDQEFDDIPHVELYKP